MLDSAAAFEELHEHLPSDPDEFRELALRMSAPTRDRAFHDTDPHEQPAMVRDRCGELVAARWKAALAQKGLDPVSARHLQDAAMADDADAAGPPVERVLRLGDGPPFAVAGSPVAGSADGLCADRTHAVEVRPTSGGPAVAEDEATVDEFGHLDVFVELPVDTPPGRYVLSAALAVDERCPAETSTSPAFEVRSRDGVDVGRDW